MGCQQTNDRPSNNWPSILFLGISAYKIKNKSASWSLICSKCGMLSEVIRKSGWEWDGNKCNTNKRKKEMQGQGNLIQDILTHNTQLDGFTLTVPFCSWNDVGSLAVIFPLIFVRNVVDDEHLFSPWKDIKRKEKSNTCFLHEFYICFIWYLVLHPPLTYTVSSAVEVFWSHW